MSHVQDILNCKGTHKKVKNFHIMTDSQHFIPQMSGNLGGIRRCGMPLRDTDPSMVENLTGFQASQLHGDNALITRMMALFAVSTESNRSIDLTDPMLGLEQPEPSLWATPEWKALRASLLRGAQRLPPLMPTADGVLWLPSAAKMKREELDQQGVIETPRGKRSSWRFAPAMHNPKCMPEKLLKQRIMFVKAKVHDDREAAVQL